MDRRKVTGTGSDKEPNEATDTSSNNGFSLKLGFWEDKARKPTNMEWQALVCEVDSFMNKELQRRLSDDSIASFAEDIKWEYVEDDYLPAQVNFTFKAMSGNGTEIPKTVLFEALVLTDVDVATFTADFINVAFPEGHSVFAFVDKLYFNGASIDSAVSDPSLSSRANCPVTVRPSDAASFTFSFDFDDEYEREPTKEEVEAMICRTNAFFQRILRDELEDPSIVSYAININWNYNPADKYSSVVQFTSLSLNGDGSHINGSTVFHVMELADMQFFLEFYILNAIPLEKNIYFYSEDVFFSGEVGRNVTAAKIPNGVKCKRYELDLLPQFTIQIGFDTRVGMPTREEIEELMCQTTRFFGHQLKLVLQDDSISSHVTNIDWEFSPGSLMPAIVNFTALSTYGEGSLISSKLVYDAMKSIAVEDFVQDYVWKVSESNIYYDTKNILFGGMIGYPPSKGKLDKVSCVAAPALIGVGNHTVAVHSESIPELAEEKVTETDESKKAHMQKHEAAEQPDESDKS